MLSVNAYTTLSVALFVSEETNVLIGRADQVRDQGIGGAYEAEFKAMEKKLAHVDNIVSSTNISTAQVASIQDLLKGLKCGKLYTYILYEVGVQ